MILVKMDVYPKSYETDDGYILKCTADEIGQAVQIAVKNGYKDIKISELRAEEKYLYLKELRKDNDL